MMYERSEQQRSSAGGSSPGPGRDRVPTGGHINLHAVSAAQERYWFLHRYEEDPSTQHASCVLELTSEHTVEDVLAAAHAVLASHPELNQRFVMTNEGLRASAEGAGPERVGLVELGPASDAAVAEAVLDVQRRALDPDRGRTAAVHLVTAGRRRFLCAMLHACVADRRSTRVLLEAIARRLAGAGEELSSAAGAAVPDQQPEHASTVDVRYWLERLGGDLEPLALPLEHPRPARKHYDAGRHVEIVAPDLAARVQAFCRETDHSSAAVYLAVYAAVLQRWTRQESLVIGRQQDLRPRGRSDAIGRFEIVVPFRIDVDEASTFTELLANVRDHLQRDAAHERLLFEELLKHHPGPRDGSRNPLVQAGYRYRADVDDTSLAGLGLAEGPELERCTTPFDIELLIDAAEGEREVTRLTLVYDEALFDREVVSRFPRHCVTSLDRCIREPESAVGSVELLDAEERAEQLEEFNDPAREYPAATVTDLFTKAVRRHLDATAVVHDDESLTYRELDALSERIAGGLRSTGVAPGACVGVCMERSLGLVATVLGILKLGAAYVPMDPAYPEERLGIIALDSTAPLVVAHRRHAGRLPASVRVLAYETLEQTLPSPRAPEGAVVGSATPESLAYVIFTSGSTGRPKGVAMPHRALVNLIEWQLERKAFAHRARVLQYSSPSFDVSFQEIFTTWISGGTLYLIADESRRDPRRLLELIALHRIERLFLPYVAFRQLVEVAQATGRYPESLTEVITAGEQLRVDEAVRAFFRQIPGASLDNQYGPSETHVVTAHLLEGDSRDWPALPPIGRPIRNNQAYVLDGRRLLLPLGAVGELYLAGVNLAHGYLGRDDLTRERFVDDPFGRPGSRMYRTGDLARYRSDGSIEFLGRADHQVKIRGYRIEPGEVDAMIARVQGVQQCVTSTFDDAKLGRRLVCYVQVDDPARFDTAAVLAHAKERLPEYMVPSAIVALTSLPFTPSGKVDVRALPDPVAAAPAMNVSRTPPRTPVERALADIWRDMLGVSDVGVTESFFDLGGDSLKAVDLFLAIERRFRRDLPLSLLAERSTIRGLAEVIEGGTDDARVGTYRSLRAIQPGDTNNNPLFLVHGGGGNVVLFHGLARRLPAHLPVYAFQWDGWNGGRGRTSIESMADSYLEEMRRIRPHGPYRLAGHCIGGIVALEIAHRLIAQGEALAGPLILSDTPNLRARSYVPVEPVPGSRDAEEMEALRRQLERRLQGGDVSTVVSVGAYRPEHGPAFRRAVRALRVGHQAILRTDLPRESAELFLNRALVRLRLLTGRRIPIDYRETYSGMSMVRALRAYRPEPYPGDVLLFRTGLFHGQRLGLGGWWRDLYLGSSELCRGRFTAHFVEATHNGVVQHPLTADILRETLDL